MEIQIIIIALFLSAIASSLIKKRWLIEIISIIGPATAFVSALSISFKVASFGVFSFMPFFVVSPLGAVVILTTSLIGLASAIYSCGYLAEETKKGIVGFNRVKQYFVFLNLFLLAMFIAVATVNPIVMWIAIEATTLSTAFLISFYNKPSAMEAAWKYLILNSVGLLLGFFGTLLYFTSVNQIGGHGIASWADLMVGAKSLDPALIKMAFVFILIGYGTKVGLAPMHTWKPDAYSKSPAPIAALFSAALLNVAFFAILRFKTVTDVAVGSAFSGRLLIAFGLLSILVAAVIIFTQKNYKRLLAYSSIEHAGFIALGFGFGGLGAFASTIHMVYHALAKSALFFTTGNVFLKYSSTKIKDVSGMISTLPITSVFFTLGFLAITGVPPFGIFLTKLAILSSGLSAYIFVTTLALFASALVFVGFLKHVSGMVFGERPEGIETGENNLWTLIPPAALIAVLFCLSFAMPDFLSALLKMSVVTY